MITSRMLQQAIASQPAGAVFGSDTFLSTGTRAAVDQALFRLMKAGSIVRVARGLYAAAGQRVQAQAVAGAVAHKTGERVGITPANGSGNVLVVPTSGPSRTVKGSEHTVHFRHMSHKKVRLATTPKGKVLLELWTEGKKNLTTLAIQRATSDWLEGEVNHYAALIPAWLRTAILQANAPRKSVKIGLSGGYDWSNPNIRDDALIGNVLQRHKFEDVAKLCFYYGTPKVKRVFKGQALEPMTHATVARMLRNISKGLRVPKQCANA